MIKVTGRAWVRTFARHRSNEDDFSDAMSSLFILRYILNVFGKVADLLPDSICL